MTENKQHEIEQTLVDINRNILAQKAIRRFLMCQAHEMQRAIEVNERRYFDLVKEAKASGLTGRYLTKDELFTLPKD